MLPINMIWCRVGHTGMTKGWGMLPTNTTWRHVGQRGDQRVGHTAHEHKLESSTSNSGSGVCSLSNGWDIDEDSTAKPQATISISPPQITRALDATPTPSQICCFPSNSSCTPYFVLFIMMPCSIQNFINYNRAFRRRCCSFCCAGRTADLLPLL